MDFPLTHSTPASFPWRTAALVAAAVAALELIVLVAVAGSALLPGSDAPTKTATNATAAAGAAKPSATKTHSTTTAAMLPRRRVSLMILNGNGHNGAASVAATKAQRRGYRIRLVGNAPRQDYPSSLVMYRPGFKAEARRLGRDMGIRMVLPLDGMRPGGLHGAHTIVILGG